MTKEIAAILSLGAALVAAVFGFGLRIGTLTERVDNQSTQIRALTSEIAGINQHLIAYTFQHRDEEAAAHRVLPVRRRSN